MGEVAQYIKDHKMQICYCEVIIDKEGRVWDAHPSHQRWLLAYYCRYHDMTEDEFWEQIVPTYVNPTYYLVEELGFISVWYDSIVAPAIITDSQRYALKELQKAEQIAKICNVTISREKSHCEYEKKIRNGEEGFSYENIPISESPYLLIDGKYRRKEVLE